MMNLEKILTSYSSADRHERPKGSATLQHCFSYRVYQFSSPQAIPKSTIKV